MLINPAREGYSSQFVCLSVCLSTSDFEDNSDFTFENGHQCELGDDLSQLNMALFFLKRPYL